MKNALLASCFLSLMLDACTKSGPAVMSVTPMETAGLLRNDFAVLVDTREENEVNATGIADQARWFPASRMAATNEDWQKFLRELPKDKQVVVYCSSSNCSPVALRIAEQKFKVADMGSFEGWKTAGLPIKKR